MEAKPVRGRPAGVSVKNMRRVLLAIPVLVVPCIVVVTSAAPAPAVTCTITGTDGDDVLTGTGRADVICGLGGSDVLIGRGGDDILICGEEGDRMEGGLGPVDVMFFGGWGTAADIIDVQDGYGGDHIHGRFATCTGDPGDILEC